MGSGSTKSIPSMNLIAKFSDLELDSKIIKLTQYSIPCIQNENLRGLANLGIKVLNTPLKYLPLNNSSAPVSYPYHWFLIIDTENAKYLVHKSPNKEIRKIDSYQQGFDLVQFCYPGKALYRGSIGDIKEGSTLRDLVNFVLNLPPEYNLIKENCQDFVSSIMVEFYAGGEEALKLVLAGVDST